jgi:L-ectoine synthase
MFIRKIDEIEGTEREVQCPHGGFVSYRVLLARDGMGFGLHKTFVPKGERQHWHYRRHKEACYCVMGRGYLTNIETGEVHEITPDTVYVLDKHDDHYFQAIDDVVLVSVFNPPVTGAEVHDADGSYS